MQLDAEILYIVPQRFGQLQFVSQCGDGCTLQQEGLYGDEENDIEQCGMVFKPCYHWIGGKKDGHRATQADPRSKQLGSKWNQPIG